MEEYKIDARGKAIGRIATDVVNILNGKNKPNYEPKEAFEQAIQTMILQLQAIVGFKGEEKVIDKEEEMSEEEIRKVDIETLNLSPSITSSLQENDIKTIGDLIKRESSEIQEIKGIGEKAIKDIRESISEYGVTIK